MASLRRRKRRSTGFAERALGFIVVLGIVYAAAWFSGFDPSQWFQSVVSSATAQTRPTPTPTPPAPLAPESAETVPAEAAEMEPSAGGSWSCFWAPTIDDNWHDDVLCTNGAGSERPQLLTDQSFVTQDEMLRAGAAHAELLNARN